MNTTKLSEKIEATWKSNPILCIAGGIVGVIVVIFMIGFLFQALIAGSEIAKELFGTIVSLFKGSSDDTGMKKFFEGITRLVIMVGSLALVLAICALILMGVKVHWGEVLVRIFSCLAGFAAYIAARVLGIALPQLLLTSMETSHPIMMWIMKAVMPFGAGVLMAFLFLKALKSGNERAYRIMILISSFVLAIYADIYATASAIQSEATKMPVNPNLLPNLSFILAIILYIIWNWKHESQENQGTGAMKE